MWVRRGVTSFFFQFASSNKSSALEDSFESSDDSEEEKFGDGLEIPDDIGLIPITSYARPLF